MSFTFSKLPRYICIFSTAALVSLCSWAAAETLEQGDSGEDITQIQTRLAHLGYNIQADGDYGPATTQAVRRFQMVKGLEADGKVGPATYRVLMGHAMPQVSRGSSQAARRVISEALNYLGAPYVFGGTSPYGFDCSGYVQYVFGRAGYSLPRSADVQFNVGRSVSFKSLRPGDLVFFETYEPGPSHVGIYLKNGDFIHAASSSGITVSSLLSGYYASRYIGARRILK